MPQRHIASHPYTGPTRSQTRHPAKRRRLNAGQLAQSKARREQQAVSTQTVPPMEPFAPLDDFFADQQARIVASLTDDAPSTGDDMDDLSSILFGPFYDQYVVETRGNTNHAEGPKRRGAYVDA